MSLLDTTLLDLVTELHNNKAKFESLKELTDKLIADGEAKDRQIQELDRRIKDLAMRLAELTKVEVKPTVIHIHYDRPEPNPTFSTNPSYDLYRSYCSSSSTGNSNVSATMTTGGVVSDKVASNFVKSPVKVEDIIGRADLSDMSNPRDPYGVEQKERDELIKGIILAMGRR